MEPAIIEDKVFEFEPFEENGSAMMAAESSWRGMADELQELHYLKGAQFINQLKLIIYYGDFYPVEGETDIFSAIGEKSERKGVYKMFDLKTITGKNSVGNRLKESLGQTDRVLLNLQTNYNIRRLSQEIRHYFEMSSNVQEVLIYNGNKEISIKRNIVSSKGFLKMMMNCFR